jgi:hypothetical protein
VAAAAAQLVAGLIRRREIGRHWWMTEQDIEDDLEAFHYLAVDGSRCLLGASAPQRFVDAPVRGFGS